MPHTPTHPQAIHACHIARLRRIIGHWAAWRYCGTHGVPYDLFVLACILENASHAGL